MDFSNAAFWLERTSRFLSPALLRLASSRSHLFLSLPALCPPNLSSTLKPRDSFHKPDLMLSLGTLAGFSHTRIKTSLLSTSREASQAPCFSSSLSLLLATQPSFRSFSEAFHPRPHPFLGTALFFASNALPAILHLLGQGIPLTFQFNIHSFSLFPLTCLIHSSLCGTHHTGPLDVGTER